MKKRKTTIPKTALIALVAAILAAVPAAYAADAGLETLVEAEADAAAEATTPTAEADTEAAADLCAYVGVTVEDGNVVMDLQAVAEATAISRAAVGKGSELLATVDGEAEAFVDASAEVGVPYTYTIATADGACAQDVVVPEPEPESEQEPEPESEQESEQEPEATCPSIRATAIEDGSVRVEIEGLQTDALLTRAEGDAEAQEIARLDAGTTVFTDTGLEHGVAYTYSIVIDGEVCDSAEVTATPFFRTALTGGIGVGVSLLGYLGIRRFM